MNNNCFLFYGGDSYQIKKESQKIINEFAIDGDAVEMYDFEEEGLSNAITSALTTPFLVDKKCVIIRNASFLTEGKTAASNEEIESLINYCDLDNPTSIFIIQAPYEKLDFRKKIVRYLDKNIVNQEFKSKDKNEAVFDFVKDELRKNKLGIDSLALTQFINRVGYDKAMIANELDKLINFAYGKEMITTEMVFEVTTRNIDDNIFELVNAVLDSDKKTMLEIYNDLMEIKTDPLWMLNAIANKFQEILYTKELIKQNYKYNDVMKYFKATKGRTYFIMKNAKDVDDDKLMNYLTELEDLDYKIKSGQITKELALELFLLKA